MSSVTPQALDLNFGVHCPLDAFLPASARRKKGESIIPLVIDGFIHSDECNVSVKSEILSRKAADFTAQRP